MRHLTEALACTLMAVCVYKIAYSFADFALPAIIAFAVLMVTLTRRQTARVAYYSSLLTGFAIAGIELTFFIDVFGPGATGLWLVLGLWLALFAVAAAAVQKRLPAGGIWWLPVLWVGFEYFRSELYWLRFSWLTPGLALTSSPWQPMLILGQYGASGVILFLAVLIVKYRSTGLTLTLALSIAGHVFNTSDAVTDQTQTGPLVVGVQLEHPNEPMVVHWLAECITQHPNAELLVLSEYTFDGPVPASVLDWCRSRQRHLIAGGKEPADGQDFRNTIFVVGPQGKIIHTQAKSVPIQFMSDGLPAISQELWQSPWGPIGIAVCYDLSYTRVIDRLVSDGAELIVNPTMDPEFWGEYQHTLHSRIPICRSVEYHVPVVRVASSGVSLITDRHGRILSSAAYARNAAMVSARPGQAKHTTLPVDRWLGPACTIATVLLMIATAWKRRGQPQPVTPEKLTAVE